MNGITEYEMNYQRKIDSVLTTHGNLYGFYGFMSNGISISSVYNYLNHAANFLEYLNGKPLNELTMDDFTGYMLKIQTDKYGRKTTSSYRITVYSALKKYGKYLVGSNQIAQNPMELIDRPKVVETQNTISKRAKGFLSKSEIKTYMRAVEQGIGDDRSISRQQNWRERDKAIITIFLNTGIRCSALMKLDVNNINFTNKTLSVIDKESKYNTYNLSDEILVIIGEWLIKRHELLSGKEIDALFISNRRKRMSQSSISNVVEKYAADIKGKHITPHKLRATYGTQLYNETKDIYFVQQCLKHNSPKTSELYIRDENNNQTAKASDIMRKLTLN